MNTPTYTTFFCYISVFLIFIHLNTPLIGQSRLSVGVYSMPTYFNNHRVYPDDVDAYYQGIDRNQFYFANGMAIDYKLSPLWHIQIGVNLLKRQVHNDCVNYRPDRRFAGYFYVADADNCLYSRDGTLYFIKFPILAKYVFLTQKRFYSYIGLGNNISYSYKRQNTLKHAHTDIVALEETNEWRYMTSWFSPTIEGGIDYPLTRRITLNGNLNIQTEKPVFSNFSIGLGLGAKVGLF